MAVIDIPASVLELTGGAEPPWIEKGDAEKKKNYSTWILGTLSPLSVPIGL